MGNKIVLRWRKNKDGFWETYYGAFKIEFKNKDDYVVFNTDVFLYSGSTNPIQWSFRNIRLDDLLKKLK